MWLMFLATVFCSYVDRCYCLVADGMPTMGVDGRCYSQGGRWIGHRVNVSVLILMFCVATYETAKELAKILKPLVGRSPHHVLNNKDFLDSIKNIKIKPDECIISCDVSALFTSIPIEPAINIIEKHLKEDTDLHSRTNMKIQCIISLLTFCLNNSYFSFQGRFYQ